jgi:wobble nucleotide-excising tRNase
MIDSINLIRNVSQFDSISPGNLKFKKLNLIYAENGRGKTSIAAVFRSLEKNEPTAITERHRLGSANPPHIVLKTAGATIQFQNGAWETQLDNIRVFDDTFVNENIYSGLSVDNSHKQNLHGLIIGAQGILLNLKLQTEVNKVEQHIRDLRIKMSAIPNPTIFSMTLEEFLKLQPHSDVDKAIAETIRDLEAARNQATIATTQKLTEISVPDIDLDRVSEIFSLNLPSLEASTVSSLQQRFNQLGLDGESWVQKGTQQARNECPFCAQDISSSSLIKQYQSYFSKEYQALKARISDYQKELERFHGGEVRAKFERDLRIQLDRYNYWSALSGSPKIEFNSVDLSTAWRLVYETILNLIKEKKNRPLEPIQFSNELMSIIDKFKAERSCLESLNASLNDENDKIDLLKEKATGSNLVALEKDLARYSAAKERYTAVIDQACQAYEAEIVEKAATEKRRDTARDALNNHQNSIFTLFNDAINRYLRKFNASFRLAEISAENSRAGSSCSYKVEINNKMVAVSARAGSSGPSFKNTLSAGDRNTLALAFFFASIEQEPNISTKLIIIDDPMTSLDDHRTITTAQEIRALSQRVGQTVVLSHTKPFLCKVWTAALDKTTSCFQINRSGGNNKSDLQLWDISSDEVTDYDKNHATIREHLETPFQDSKRVAQCIRPVLEGYLRVVFPAEYPPTTLLGPFINLCRQRVGQKNQILNNTEIDELENLKEYANKFHHDSNPAWETVSINDTELTGFIQRTLIFVSH